MMSLKGMKMTWVSAVQRTLLLLGLVMPLHANAASHDVSACLWLEDDRYFMDFIGGDVDHETKGESIALTDLPVSIEYEVLGVFVPAIGDLSTGSDGCFSAELSGVTVPQETRIRLSTVLSNSDFRVFESGEGTIRAEWGEKRVTRSSPHARFGTIIAAAREDEEPVNTPLVHWANAQTLKEKYSAQVQPWRDGNFKKLDIEWPAPRGTSGGFASGGRKVTFSEGVRSNFAYFYHEWGHWMGHNQSRDNRSDRAGYCYDLVSSTFPKSKRPYLYYDPDSLRSGGDEEDCSHVYDNPEAPVMAFVEGVADFIAASLFFGGKCDSSIFEDRPLSFDGQANERTVQSVLCDLRDSDSESTSALHLYQPEGAVRILAKGSEDVPNPSLAVQDQYGTRFIGAENQSRSVLEADFTTAVSSRNWVSRDFSDLLPDEQNFVAVGISEEWLCAAQARALVCQHRSGFVSTFRKAIPLPTPSIHIHDLKVVGNDVYLLFRHFGTQNYELRKWELPPGGIEEPLITKGSTGLNLGDLRVQVWSPPIWSEPVITESTKYALSRVPQRFALQMNDEGTSVSRIWIARLHSVETCSLDSTSGGSTRFLCSNGSLRVAGSATEKGYSRGGDGDAARFDTISHLRIGRQRGYSEDQVFVLDRYGVSFFSVSMSNRRASTDLKVEQWIGAGLDHIFKNNLSLRSIAFDSPPFSGPLWFASDGASHAFVISSRIEEWNLQRSASSDRVWMKFDLTQPETQRVYCGEDRIEVSNRRIFHGGEGLDFYTTLTDYLSDAIGMSSSDSRAVRAANFASLESSGCDVNGYRGSFQETLEGAPEILLGGFNPKWRLPREGIWKRPNAHFFPRHSAREWARMQSEESLSVPESARVSSKVVAVKMRDRRAPVLRTRVLKRANVPRVRLSGS